MSIYFWRKYFAKKINLQKNINYRKKIIFIHIPKNAGTAINNLLFKRDSANHLTVKEYEINNKFRKKIKKYFVFAVVRNPFDRFVSLYTYLLKTNHKKQSSTEEYKKLNKEIKQFKNFNEFVLKFSKFKYKNLKAFKTQHSFIENKTNAINKIIYFEKLDQEFEPIRKKYNLKKIPRINISQKKYSDWRDYYNLKSAKIVYLKYKKDFDLWYPNEYEKLKTYLKEKNKQNKKKKEI